MRSPDALPPDERKSAVGPWQFAYTENVAYPSLAADLVFISASLLLAAYGCQRLMCRSRLATWELHTIDRITATKARWLRLHLSTAVILMFAAGIVLALNFHGASPTERFQSREGFIYGWPFPCYFSQARAGGPIYVKLGMLEVYSLNPFGVSYFALAMNAMIGFAILCGIGLFCECQIRARQARE